MNASTRCIVLFTFNKSYSLSLKHGHQHLTDKRICQRRMLLLHRTNRLKLTLIRLDLDYIY